MKDYTILKPRKGYVVIKEVEEKEKVMIKSGEDESRAIGRIVCLPEGYDYQLKINDLVVYNEYEGQELFKYGPIDEDKIIVIKESDILLWIDEDNIQNDVQPIPKEPKKGTAKQVKGS